MRDLSVTLVTYKFPKSRLKPANIYTDIHAGRNIQPFPLKALKSQEITAPCLPGSVPVVFATPYTAPTYVGRRSAMFMVGPAPTMPLKKLTRTRKINAEKNIGSFCPNVDSKIRKTVEPPRPIDVTVLRTNVILRSRRTVRQEQSTRERGIAFISTHSNKAGFLPKHPQSVV